MSGRSRESAKGSDQDGPPKERGPLVGLWGAFDLDTLESLLLPRVFERELLGRLPRARVQVFAPFGHRRPLPPGLHQTPRPLGFWSSERAALLSEELDCVVTSGSQVIQPDERLASWYGLSAAVSRSMQLSFFFVEGLGEGQEESCSLIWHGVRFSTDPDAEFAGRISRALLRKACVGVLDEASRELLGSAGVQRDVEVVPDPLILVPRVFPRDDLEPCVRYLRLLGHYPSRRPPLVLHVTPDWERQVEQVVRSVVGTTASSSPSSLLLLGSEDDSLVANGELQRLAGGQIHRLSSSSDIEHRVAAIANAAAYIGSSSSGSAMAFAYGIPTVHLRFDGSGEPAGSGVVGIRDVASSPEDVPRRLERALSDPTPDPDRMADPEKRLDAHYDRIAEIADSSAGRARQAGHAALSPAELLRAVAELDHLNAALRTALAARAGQSSRERAILTGEIDRLSQVETRAEQQSRELAILLGEVDRLSQEIDLRSLEIGRLSAQLEAIFRSWRWRWPEPALRLISPFRRRKSTS